MRPVWDDVTGHKTAEMVVWLCQHGIMPLYTPPGGSFQQIAEAWNRQPTPFLWNGTARGR